LGEPYATLVKLTHRSTVKNLWLTMTERLGSVRNKAQL
jgi:hypothetical protein